MCAENVRSLHNPLEVTVVTQYSTQFLTNTAHIKYSHHNVKASRHKNYLRTIYDSRRVKTLDTTP